MIAFTDSKNRSLSNSWRDWCSWCEPNLGGEETRAKGVKGAKVNGIKDGEIMTGLGGG